MIALSSLAAAVGLSASPAPQPRAAPQEVSPEDARYFHERVLPILSASCFECHGPAIERVKGGLRMGAGSALLIGGPSGPAVVPGDPDASLIVQAVRHEDPFLEMPPDGRLEPEQIAVLEEWVRRGAPWIDLGGAAELREGGIDVAAGRSWWAFQPVTRPDLPATQHAELVRDPLDRFVFARLEAAGLEPSGPAERRVLARRLWFDLLGLPPTYAELEAFVADTAPDAYERLVDQLLERPEYGERWARHWLDLVRFAQTNGYERDSEKPYAWRYRDYVVRAFNQDKPYDRFVLEQLAGDELPDADADSLIATALYRLGAWDDEPANPEQALFDELDDNLNTISTGLLGVTLACARCHDHKFDPFPQEDYYSMLAFLRSVRPYAKPVFDPASATLRTLDSSRAARERWERERGEALAALAAQREAMVERGRAGLAQEERDEASEQECVATLPLSGQRQWFLLKMQMEELEGSFEGELEWTLAVTEAGGEPLPTHLLIRGAAGDEGHEVQPRFPLALCADDAAGQPALPPVDPANASTGRRTALAQWIASPHNPLTARVIVNRVWQFHFGQGLVPTSNDFGAQGLPPTHPELLDWLASTFVEDGWSLKRLHRRILNSYTWRMASRVDPELSARALEVDPGNQLLWRQRPSRLDAEVLRDSILSAAGTLEPAAGGRGFFPAMSAEALSGLSRPGAGWELDSERARSRRSLYIFAKRSLPVPFIEVFDGPGSAVLPVGGRTTTTVATQALTLLNDEFTGRAARDLALRVVREAGASDAQRIEQAFRLALGRRPSAAEAGLAAEYLTRTQAELERLPRNTLAFRPALPERVSLNYLRDLRGGDVLDGPRAGWRYLRGAWGGNYSETIIQDGNRGPAALFESLQAQDGLFSTRLRLANGCRRAGLLFRASCDVPLEQDRAAAHEPEDLTSGKPRTSIWNVQPVGDEVFEGLELRLDPQAGVLQLWHHGEDMTFVAGANAPITTETWLDLRVELQGQRVRVWLGDAAAPLLAAQLDALDPAGALGVRLAGGALELEQPLFAHGDVLTSLLPTAPVDARSEALQSLCLMLFNLNEFVYAD